MPDIYNLLSKHFLNETSEQEEQRILEFKSENNTEYSFLKKLWKKGGEKTEEFDSKLAWNKVQKEFISKETKIIPFYQRIRRYAAVAVILIVGTLSAYFYTNQNIHLLEVNNSETPKELLLADGSKVWLNKNASLSFPKKFEGNKREVVLTGEAFFEITKNPSKPFLVNTFNSVTRVLGTSFNVDSKDEKTTVSVKTGEVQVSILKEYNSEFITPGQSATVEGENVSKFKTLNDNYLAWKTKVLTFENHDLKEVITSLENYFNVEINVESKTISDCKFTGEFKDLTLEEIFEIMSFTYEMSFSKTDNHYLINLKNCN